MLPALTPTPTLLTLFVCASGLLLAPPLRLKGPEVEEEEVEGRIGT